MWMRARTWMDGRGLAWFGVQRREGNTGGVGGALLGAAAWMHHVGASEGAVVARPCNQVSVCHSLHNEWAVSERRCKLEIVWAHEAHAVLADNARGCGGRVGKGGGGGTLLRSWYGFCMHARRVATQQALPVTEP